MTKKRLYAMRGAAVAVFLFFVMLLCVYFSGLPSFIINAEKEPFIVVGNEENVVFTENATMPEAFGVDSDLGMKITSYNENSMAEINRVMFGSFDMAFRIPSLERGTGDPANRKIDYSILTVLFVDATDENNYFTVEFTGNNFWGSNYVKAMVGYKDFTGGRNQDYGNQIMAPGATVNGSFESSSPYACKSSFAYDADTQRVLVNTYSGGADGGSKNYVVVDLDDADMVGKNVFRGFENGYRVRIRASAFVEPKNKNRPAEIIVYTINGQSVASKQPQNDIGPTVTASFQSSGVKGMEYLLPDAYCFDYLDGYSQFYSNSKNQVKVIAPNKTEEVISLSERKFTPTQIGEYTVSFTAYDEAGVAGAEKQYKLNVLSQAPSITLSIAGVNRETVAVGKQFTLFPAKAYSPLSLREAGEVDCFVLVKKETEVLLNESVNTPVSCVLNGEGEYSIIYKGVDYLGNEQLEEQTIICRNEPNITYGEFPRAVFVDKELVLPEVHATFNGGDNEVKTYITNPYGEIDEITQSTYIPQLNGEYLLTYKSFYGDGQFAVEHIPFTVGIGPADLFYSVKNGEVTSNVNAPEYSQPFNGVQLKGIGEGSEIGFSNVIDATTLTKDVPLIDFQITPKIAGKEEFKKLFIYITDVSNPNSKITIEIITSQWDNRWAYIKAAADNNVLMGVWYDGIPDQDGNYPVLENFNGGTQIRNSFAGVPYLDLKTKLFKIYYDYAEKALYTEDHLNNLSKILDFDNPTHVGGGREWAGFTSDKVRISFKFAEVVSNPSILIHTIAGQPMSAVSIADEIAPSIALDLQGNTSSPDGLVGRKYFIPKAECFDMIDGIIENVSVVVKHENGTVYEVEGGYITPDLSGKYIVSYTACDRSGNRAVKEYVFHCYRALPPIEISFSQTVQTSIFVGESLFLPEGDVVGGSGKKILRIFLVYNEKILPVESGYSYYIAEAGKYYVYAIAEDYLNQRKTVKIEVNATVSATPIQKEVNIPDAMINGKTYVLPACEAFDFNQEESSGGFTATGTISVYYKGVEQRLDGNNFTPNVENDGDMITIVYKSENGFGSVQKEYSVKVLKPTTLADYYLKENVSAQLSEEYIAFTTSTNGANFSFVNPLSTAKSEIVFDIDGNANNFTYVDLIFTDYDNRANTFFLRIKKRPMNENGNYYTTSYASINGVVRDIEIVGSFYDNSRNAFKIIYDDATKTLSTYSGVEIGVVNYTSDGKKFEGFGDKAYLSFEFGGVEGVSTIRMTKLMNQLMYGKEGEEFSDRTPPAIDIHGTYSFSADLGEKITVFSASVLDVVDVNAVVRVSVIDPSGTKVFDKVSADIAHEFSAERYGRYKILYEAIDSSNRKFTRTIGIDVEDKIPPEVVVENLAKTVYSLGEVVVVPSVSCTDNYDDYIEVGVYIKTPLYRYIAVNPNGQFVATAKGKYELIVFAKDANYSYTIAKYVFTVIS
ncbi:MAG: hypothetical protein ACI4SH_04600 [Candidatus Scatosoma sp.]